MTKLKCLPDPLSPPAEQPLSVVDELEAMVTADLQRAARSRQAILQKAFSGGF